MAADVDHDGRITYEEAMKFADPTPQDASRLDRISSLARQFLQFAPEGKKAVALSDVETAAVEFFRKADTDTDGVISDAELKAVRLQMQAALRAAAPPAQNRAEERGLLPRENMTTLCPMPKPSDAAKLVLVGTNESEALSNVAIGSQDVAVGVGNIAVEPGNEPIYLVVTSFRPTIWRLYGATERIERLVLTSTMPAPTKALPANKPLVGAVGLPADRITFLEQTKCVGHFTALNTRQASFAAIAVRIDTGRDVGTSAGLYSLSDVSVPSGAVHGSTHGKLVIVSKGPVTIRGDDPNIILENDRSGIDIDLKRFYPGGVVELDPARVVASMPVERYDVLPGRAGLAQLVKAGKLEVKDGEFLIKQKIRFPAGLTETDAMNFRLLRGVPKPDGNPGDSKVIFDETGEQIQFDEAPR